MTSFYLHGSKYSIPILHPNDSIKKYLQKSGGDLQQLITKIPDFLPWTKYQGEKHAKGYNYLGPGTRLDIRLDEFDEPYPGEDPINPIDELAYHHDIAYRSDNIEDRNKADQVMIDGLKGLNNLTLSQRLLRAMIIKLFNLKIKFGVGLQYANEIHKQYKRPTIFRKVNFKHKDNIWCADLIIMPPEKGYKYILTILDGFTRFAFVVPLKDKKGITIFKAFKHVIKESKRRPDKLWVDQGKEFYNENMYKLFKYRKSDIEEKDDKGEYKNKIYSVFNTSKNPVIERFNRTLTSKIWKEFSIKKTTNG